MSVLLRMRSGSGLRTGFRAAAALFCLRAVIPLGYMPASLADGGPFALCPGTSGPTLAALATHGTTSRAEHAGHAGIGHDGPAQGSDTQTRAGDAADDSSGAHDAHWEHCPLGIGAGDAAFAPSFTAELTEGAPLDSRPAAISAPALSPIAAFRARAPPL